MTVLRRPIVLIGVLVVAVGLVAVGLVVLVWTLITRADDAGAISAAWSAVPPLPDLPATHQGEL